MSGQRILLVDDDEQVRSLLGEVLEIQGFEITMAASVPEALKHISANVYDVLLSDLHMPGAGDGLTVISAMRHANPDAVTILLSAFPEMHAASQAILQQTDQILVKPVNMKTLVDTIKDRLAFGPPAARIIETVAAILERTADSTIQDWYEHVQTDKKVMAISLSHLDRIGYLHQVFIDLVDRLRSSRIIGGPELPSLAAAEHGLSRRQAGYTAAMMVEESRMLQVSIFRTLQKNLPNIDFSVLLIGVMTIADEIDSQLSQAMASYIQESVTDALPA
jgi:CheY-like chemotaxis protein